MNTLVLVTAPREAALAKRRISLWNSSQDNTTSRTHPSSIVSVFTVGIGDGEVRMNLGKYLSVHRPNMIILVGTAAGLSKSAAVGDVVIPRSVLDVKTQRQFDLHSPLPAVNGAGSWRSVESLATINYFLASTLEREMLRQSTGAFAIDMESSAVADIGQQHGIPVIIVRAISDFGGEDANLQYHKNIESAMTRALQTVDRILASNLKE